MEHETYNGCGCFGIRIGIVGFGWHGAGLKLGVMVVEDDPKKNKTHRV